MSKDPFLELTGTTSLWSIGADLDDTHVQLEHVRDLLYVFDENMESELNFMKQSNDVYVKHFLARYDTLHSVMDVLRIHLSDAIDAMRLQIDAVYEADRKNRLRPLPTE